jgi:sensor histidine kinase YesM
MSIRLSTLRSKWWLVLIATNVAVLMAMMVVLASGQVSSLRDFLTDLAQSLIFANIMSAVAMLVLGAPLERLARDRRPVLPYAIVGIAVIILLGLLAREAVLVALHVVSATRFWPDYLYSLKVSLPLGLVFGSGAIAYSALVARLELTQLKLREKELTEERTRKLAAEARLRSLESWIHPHFLFNTLNSISALIAIDPARADQVVGSLSRLLRASLDGNTQSLISLRQELALVLGYLDIERVRLGDRLHSRIDIPLDIQSVSVPPMSLQSLVENAVKYGIGPQPNGGEILVTAVLRQSPAGESCVCISICDTGPGFNLGAIPAGHGLDKLIQRLDALFGETAELNVFRRDNWSVVEIILPCL